MKRQPKWLWGLGNSKDAVFVVDSSQRILTWNKAAERLLGYSAAEVLNRHCYDVVAGRLPSGKLWCRSKCEVQRCVQRGGLVEDYDMLVSTKDGREVCVDVSMIALPRRNRSLLLHLLRDATRREKSQRALEDFLDVLRTSGLLRRIQERQRDGAPRAIPSAALSLPTIAQLTQREIEVLKLLREGTPTEAMATTLGISELTVRSHTRNILRKCGAHSKAEAVSRAAKAGLL